MSDEVSPEAPVPPEAHSERHESGPKPIFLISYPKIIFLYPSFFAALLAGFLMLGFGISPIPEANRAGELTTLAFLGIFGMNLVVLAFDFPRTTSLTLFFFIGMVLMGLFLLFHFNPQFLGPVGEVIASLKPIASAQFYFLFAGILFCFYLMVLVSVRFDYWEVRPNELLNHHGYLSDLKRHPAPNIRIDKEINDVFEYLLLGSGRLIIHPSSEPRAIVLENVLFIDKKEQNLTRMLGSLQVQITSGNRDV